jgi:pilus assembly protein CpaE
MVALEMANHILLVTQLDLPCLRNIVRLMMSFGQMDAIKDKVKIVVNRVGLDNHIGLKKAQETIGREIFWQLPNDYRVMVEVRNNGVPLIEQAPKAAITQSIIALAEALCGSEEDKAATAASTGKGSTVGKLLNLWPGRTRTPAAK